MDERPDFSATSLTVEEAAEALVQIGAAAAEQWNTMLAEIGFADIEAMLAWRREHGVEALERRIWWRQQPLRRRIVKLCKLVFT